MAMWVIGAVMRVFLFALSGWILVRVHRAHPVVAILALIASTLLWRFVPWQQLRLFDDTTHRVLHAATAIGGIVVGALVGGTYRSLRHAATR